MPNTIRSSIDDLAKLGMLDAHELTDEIVDLLIADFMRDPTMPRRTYSEWRMRLAAARAHIVVRIYRRVDQHVDVEDVLRTLQHEEVL